MYILITAYGGKHVWYILYNKYWMYAVCFHPLVLGLQSMSNAVQVPDLPDLTLDSD